MPDWSYHTIFKNILFQIPGNISREFIHKTMGTLASLSLGRQIIRFLGHMDASPQIQVKTNDFIFSSPIGLSGKIDPNLSATNAFANLGFSFIEIGPVTLYPSQAVENPYYDKKKQIIVFRCEQASLGLEKTIDKLSSYANLAPHKIIRIKGTLTECIEIAKALEQYGDIFVLDYSINLKIEHVIEIKQLLKGKSLFLSITPKHVNDSVTSFLQVVNEFEIDGIVLDGDGEEKSLNDLLTSLKLLRMGNKEIPIITSGGIVDPKDAISLLTEGATLLLLSTGYVITGPGLPKRINELIYYRNDKELETVFTGWIWYWLFGLCIVLGGILALVFSMTRVILPYDEVFLGITRDELIAFNENVLFFMAHDRMTLSGTMISGGILYMQLAKHGIKYGIHWCRKAVNIAGIIGFLGILLFIGFGYFDWLHGLFWLILFPFFIAGYIKTKNVIHTPKSQNDSNHFAWKCSLYGQLAFIMLGFSFVIGGLIISYIGATFVFVQTDIGYLCMPPEMIEQFNDGLISVIAHDRAGFGSALLSTGLLVFMVSLWGFRERAKWVWWSLFIGGIPAFLAGIITHFVIGYTTFSHLLPAYIACGLYVCGLLLSYPYLMKKNS